MYAFIRSLCVSNCTLVTDLGISWFCDRDKKNVDVRCGGLEFLLIRDTSVTSFGVHLAVKNLRKLKQLDCNEDLRNCVPAAIVRPMSHMTSFTCTLKGKLTIEKYSLLSPDALIQYRSTRMEDDVYNYQLASMFDLSAKLIVRPSRQTLFPYISFRLGIVPCLTRFGALLKNLSLDNFSDVDIFFITSTSPLIQSITLQRCSYRDPTTSLIPLPARNIPPSFIETIIYEGTMGGYVSSHELFHLLMSPKLTNISFSFCSTVNDDILFRAFDSHRFQHLKRITLFFCCNVSNEAFKSVFLVEPNVLEYVKIVACQQLSMPEVRVEWKELARTNNWDVEFVFLF